MSTRRERVRAATVEEIKQTARTLLVNDGPTGVTLRAIGRQMGLTAAALYRYFPNLESLVNALCADLYDDLTRHLERARDAVDSTEPGDRLIALCRAFRRWSLDHPTEFTVMFGSPLPALAGPQPPGHDPEHVNQPAHRAGMRFAAVFGTLFAELWTRAPFPVPAPDEIPPALRVQLEAYIGRAGVDLPAGAAQVFLSSWIRLYGMVALEVYGHLHFALDDVEPMFEGELAQWGRQLGLCVPTPG
jgi:AcrR family transcriptional regulator